MSNNPINIPNGSTHFFSNTKNKKSFYKYEDGWMIHNKGLNTWEKVPNLDLTLLPISELNKNNSTQNIGLCSDIETTDVTITDVIFSSNLCPEIALHDFKTPVLTLDDLLYMYELFEKYAKDTLGFIPGQTNYSIYYDHELKRWSYAEDYECEGLTIYTTDFSVIEKVLNDLNQI